MALTPITPRDRVQRLVDLGRKTWRYAWLVAMLTVVGIGLSLAFALTRPRSYQSWTVLSYQERIQSSLVSPNREEIAQRNVGDRYRELLLARNLLIQILNDPTLDPFPPGFDPELKLEKLRLAVKFSARGAMMFRIEYTDSDPERARKVTDRLTTLLKEKDEALRNEQARETVAFITKQKEDAEEELHKRERALNEFLARHPEFVSDGSGAPKEGISILSQRNRPTATAPTRLSGKERQLQRIIARLNAPDAPAVSTPLPPSPERLAAEAEVKDAKRELAAAQRELDTALSNFTERHPQAIKAQSRVEAALQRVRQAEAALPPAIETVERPTTAEDRARLEKERAKLEAEIRAEQNRTGRPSEVVPQDNTEERVVKLESENSELRRNLTEQRERVQSLAAGVFRATIDANQKLAEQGGRLAIIDPAFKPFRPTGPGKTIFLMAGVLLFFALGLAFALALAVIDDRLYRRADLDQIGLPVLAVIPPEAKARRRKPAKAKPAKAKPAPAAPAPRPPTATGGPT